MTKPQKDESERISPANAWVRFLRCKDPTSNKLTMFDECVSNVQSYGKRAQKLLFLGPFASGDLLGCICLTEPHAGSDAFSLQTRAVRHGDQ